MDVWLQQLDEEQQKLNQLGNESLGKGIPLCRNDAVYAQSRRVDELIIELLRRIGIKEQVRLRAGEGSGQ